MIIRESAVVYRSTRSGRRFFTRRAAVAAEASAIIQSKYPTERQESDSIGITNRGWHWREDDRLCRVFNRLSRVISRHRAEISDA